MADGQGSVIVTEPRKPMPDTTKMTQEEWKKYQRKKMSQYRDWEDSFEGINYNTHIECPAGHDDALVIQVLHDIPRRYRTKAPEFIYFLMISGVKGYVSPFFVPGGAKDQKKTLRFLLHKMPDAVTAQLPLQRGVFYALDSLREEGSTENQETHLFLKNRLVKLLHFEQGGTVRTSRCLLRS
jgi:hypothetical protein